MVFQVTNDNNIGNLKYASFHPKLWLLRYVNHKNDVLYRFVVLSRNLTFDRGWDLSFSMDGKITEKQNNKNNPLISFIEYLSSHSNKVKRDKINEIVKELKFVNFELKLPFDGFEFIVNGIPSSNPIQNQQLFKSNSLEKLLIMTPFLSNDIIKDFNNRKNSKSKAILISRLNSLSQLKGENLDNFEFYSLKDEVIDGESLLSEGSEQSLKDKNNENLGYDSKCGIIDNEKIIAEDFEQFPKQDIHAKMYVVEKTKYTDLYLGSLNASYNALNGNVEFMIKLNARKSRFNINKLLKELFNEKDDNPFHLVNMKNINEYNDEKNNLNLIVKNIVRLKACANISSGKDSYDLEVKFVKDCVGYDIEINPLLSNKTAKFSRNVVFKNLTKVQLSEFFVITVKKDEDIIRRVIKIPIDNLPEDRQKVVISNVIKDKTAFIKYVAFLLGDEYVLSHIEVEGNSENRIPNNFTVPLPELYEKMLKSAMYTPEKFVELEFLIKTLSNDNVIPDGFKELYETFKQVIDDE